jgi:hypothetical protein
VRELENVIKSSRPKAIKRKIGQGQREPIVAILEEHLQQALATKVRISKRKKGGHINIEFILKKTLRD